MKEKLQEDLKTAMKGGDKARTMVLRGLLAEISRYEVEKGVRRDADEAAVIQILKREHARRVEALEFARKAGRENLIEQNEAEIKVIDEYLPAAVGADEVRAAVEAEMAQGVSQMGPIMKVLREKFGARLDGKTASEIVKQALQKGS